VPLPFTTFFYWMFAKTFLFFIIAVGTTEATPHVFKSFVFTAAPSLFSVDLMHLTFTSLSFSQEKNFPMLTFLKSSFNRIRFSLFVSWLRITLWYLSSTLSLLIFFFLLISHIALVTYNLF
jgi:hypothetical protein